MPIHVVDSKGNILKIKYEDGRVFNVKTGKFENSGNKSKKSSSNHSRHRSKHTTTSNTYSTNELINKVKNMSIYTRQEREEWIKKIKAGDKKAIEQAKKLFRKGVRKPTPQEVGLSVSTPSSSKKTKSTNPPTKISGGASSPFKSAPSSLVNSINQKLGGKVAVNVTQFSKEAEELTKKYSVSTNVGSEFYTEANKLAKSEREKIEKKWKEEVKKAQEANKVMKEAISKVKDKEAREEIKKAIQHNEQIIKKYDELKKNKAFSNFEKQYKEYLFYRMAKGYKELEHKKELEKEAVLREAVNKDIKIAGGATLWHLLSWEDLDTKVKAYLPFSTPSQKIEAVKELEKKIPEFAIKKYKEAEKAGALPNYSSLGEGVKDVIELSAIGTAKTALGAVDTLTFGATNLKDTIKDKRTDVILDNTIPETFAEGVLGGVAFGSALEGISMIPKVGSKVAGVTDAVASAGFTYALGSEVYKGYKEGKDVGEIIAQAGVYGIGFGKGMGSVYKGGKGKGKSKEGKVKVESEIDVLSVVDKKNTKGVARAKTQIEYDVLGVLKKKEEVKSLHTIRGVPKEEKLVSLGKGVDMIKKTENTKSYIIESAVKGKKGKTKFEISNYISSTKVGMEKGNVKIAFSELESLRAKDSVLTRDKGVSASKYVIIDKQGNIITSKGRVGSVLKEGEVVSKSKIRQISVIKEAKEASKDHSSFFKKLKEDIGIGHIKEGKVEGIKRGEVKVEDIFKIEKIKEEGRGRKGSKRSKSSKSEVKLDEKVKEGKEGKLKEHLKDIGEMKNIISKEVEKIALEKIKESRWAKLSKLDIKPLLKIKPRTTLMPKSVIKPKTVSFIIPKIKEKEVLEVNQATSIIPKVKEKEEVVLKEESKAISKSISETKIETQEVSIPNIETTPSPHAPFEPKKGGGGLFGGIGLLGGLSLSRGKSLKFKKVREKYKPSLSAIAFGITSSKAPKSLTGLGIRPIIEKKKSKKKSGSKKSKGKSKKKRKK